MEQKDLGKTSIGIQANLGSLLCYIPSAGFIISIIFYCLEKENKFLRFHALQSILLGVACIIIIPVISFIRIIGLLSFLVGLAAFVLLIILMIKSYNGQKIKLPVIGDIAEKNS